MEDGLDIWQMKTTSFFQKMEDNLNLHKIEYFGKWEMKVNPKKNPSVRAAAKTSLKLLQKLSRLEASQTISEADMDEARLNLHNSRLNFKKIVRNCLAEERDIRDMKLHNIISNPSAAFSAFRAG